MTEGYRPESGIPLTSGLRRAQSKSPDLSGKRRKFDISDITGNAALQNQAQQGSQKKKIFHRRTNSSDAAAMNKLKSTLFTYTHMLIVLCV